MSYGIKTYSSSGRVLIDSERSGFTQVMSGNLSVSESRTHSRRGEISVPSKYGSYGQYLVAYLPPRDVPISYWGNVLYARSGSISVPYIVFAQTSSVYPSADNWGLRIWNAGGDLTFDSGLKTFNVISSHTPRSGQNVSGYGGEWIIAGSGETRGLFNVGGYNGAFATCFLGNKGSYFASALAPFEIGPQTTMNTASEGPYSLTRIKVT